MNLKDVFASLKERLKSNKDNYIEENSWCGDTESGFYTETKFDMEALYAEIDEFSKELAERALLAAAPAPIQKEPAAPVAWQPSEEQFESWRSRHGLHHSHSEAFYDAASLYLDATPPALARSQVQAAGDVLAERERQKQQEGWTDEHDDQYEDGELCGAAACYTMADDSAQHEESPNLWPWPEDWWKPTTKRRNLVKAGALILAEIERLDRAAMREQKP